MINLNTLQKSVSFRIFLTDFFVLDIFLFVPILAIDFSPLLVVYYI